MGQEKSLPVRCNSCHNYSSSTTTTTTAATKAAVIAATPLKHKRYTSRSTSTSSSSPSTKKSHHALSSSTKSNSTAANCIHSALTRASSHQSATTTSTSFTSTATLPQSICTFRIFTIRYLQCVFCFSFQILLLTTNARSYRTATRIPLSVRRISINRNGVAYEIIDRKFCWINCHRQLHTQHCHPHRPLSRTTSMFGFKHNTHNTLYSKLI